MNPSYIIILCVLLAVCILYIKDNIKCFITEKINKKSQLSIDTCSSVHGKILINKKYIVAFVLVTIAIFILFYNGILSIHKIKNFFAIQANIVLYFVAFLFCVSFIVLYFRLLFKIIFAIWNFITGNTKTNLERNDLLREQNMLLRSQNYNNSIKDNEINDLRLQNELLKQQIELMRKKD